jgi:hypothetical protein
MIMTNTLCAAEDSVADIFTDLQYICQSTNLISDSLQRGCDVAQLSNGEIIVTEMKVISTQYVWDTTKQKMIKTTKTS